MSQIFKQVAITAVLLLTAAVVGGSRSGSSYGGRWPATNPSALGWINVMDYGCKADGVTDDAACIEAAATAANPTDASGIYPGGKVVYFPVGIYQIKSTVRIRASQRWLGTWRSGSVIRADATFPRTGAFEPIVIEDCNSGTNNCHGSFLDSIYLDGNDRAQVGLQMNDQQEMSGLRNVEIYRVTLNCVRLTASGGSTQNGILDEGTCVPSDPADANFVGLELTIGADPMRSIQGWSITPGTTATDADCIHSSVSAQLIESTHCELKGRGIVLSGIYQTVIGLDHRGSSGKATLDISGPAIILGVIKTTGGGTVINDTWSSGTHTNTATYVLGTPYPGPGYIMGGGSGNEIYTLELNDTGRNEIDFPIKPSIRGWSRLQPIDTVPTCVAGIAGTTYYDTSLKEMCVCTDDSAATYDWDEVDGGASGTAANCG